jgi:hypothetical protein
MNCASTGQLLRLDIVALILDTIPDGSTFSAKSLQASLEKHRMGVSLSTCYSVMETVRYHSNEPWENGFNVLRWYCNRLLADNPGII